MKIDSNIVKQAKEKLGDENAHVIAKLLGIEDMDENNLKALCPFHAENTPSFVYDKKRFSFHCFGCRKNVDIIDAYMLSGKTYIEAVQELFKLAGIKYSFGMRGVKELGSDYRYPHDEQTEDIAQATDYWHTRGISEATLKYCGVGQDAHGNTAFRYFDSNDVLCMVKYRPSHKVKHGESKAWAQRNADTTPLLYNMARINMDKPLLITEGECDCLSAIEAGFTNTVSVPFGAGNFTWIDTNWDWLDGFETIIICGDNDKPGREMNRELAHRLGLWRTKVVELPEIFMDDNGEPTAISDINDVLCTYGREEVMQCILKAKESPIDTVADVADIADVEINELDGLYMGLDCMDSELSKSLLYGSLNILTGINGCVDGNTEFLSRDGWKRMDEYREGDEVLTFSDDGTAAFEAPLDYTNARCDEMLAFHSMGVRQTVTPEHTMIYVDSAGRLQRETAEEVAKQHASGKFKGRFIQSFEFLTPSFPHNITSAGLRVQTVAIMMGSPLFGGKVLITLGKLPDAKYLESLLDEAGISYARTKRRNMHLVTFKPPRTMRRFEGIFYKLNRNQRKIVYAEVCRWRRRKIGYHPVCACYTREEAGYVQFLQASLGILTRMVENNGLDDAGRECGEYLLMPIDARRSSMLDGNIPVRKIQPDDGRKYCFTVTSGMFVTRREGIINITGNSGKSSFLSQLICQCLEQGRDAWLYSMELPNYMARSWMQYVMAGPRHVDEKRDPRGRLYYTVPQNVKEQIDAYWKGRVFVYKDGCRNTIGDILESMEESARRFGCKLFVLDNLTAINIEANENNKWDKQNETVTKLIDFAKKYDVAVVLVVHPRKMEMVRRMSKFDVQGSGGMVDLAHRAFSLYRVSPREKQGVPNRYGDGWKIPPIKHDVLLDVLKDRFTGRENMEVGLFFDKASMRFFGNRQELNYQYGWEKDKIPESEWIWPERCNVEDCPF